MKEKTKIIARFVSQRNESLLHKETLGSFPVNDRGILSFIPRYIPVSHQGKLKKALLKKLRQDFQTKTKEWKTEIEKIWSEELEIILIYKLCSKYSCVDVDNLNKFMIDSMKGILFKDDKQVKLVVGRKDKINEKYLRGKYVEKTIIRIDFFKNSKVNDILNKTFKNDKADDILEEN